MTFRKRSCRVLLLGALALWGSAGPAPGQAIIITSEPIKDFAEDYAYLLEAISRDGDPAARATIDGFRRFRSGEMVKGLDQSRGVGLAITLPREPAPGAMFSVVAAVPVTDLGGLLDSLQGMGFAVDGRPGVPGFTHKVTLPNGRFSLYVLQSRSYALFSSDAAGADRLRKLDPSSWRPKGRPAGALSARILISQIPRALRDRFLTAWAARMAQQRQRQPGENEGQYRGRLAGQDMGDKAITTLLREGEAIALDINVDRKTGQASVDLAITARAGTATAANLKSFAEKRSRFQGLARDAAGAAWARLPISKQIRDSMTAAIVGAMERQIRTIEPPETRQALTRLNELVKANLNAPEVDLGLAILRSTPAGRRDPRFVLLAGMALQDGRAFDRAVREAIARVPPGAGVRVVFDAVKAKDGTAIHQITGFQDNDAAVKRVFGKGSAFFAFRRDAVLVAVGEDGLAALRRAIEQVAAPPPRVPGSGGPVGAVASAVAIGELGGEDPEKLRRAAAELFRGQSGRRDRFALDVTAERDGIRLRLTVDLPAIKLAGMAGTLVGH